ncbi:MAG: ABC transporter permease [Candidatus Omnitrophica bacterium]|nr:ABC transporter permease [Candidatus Omnitrophota bacterium]
MFESIKELLKYHDLLYMLTLRDLRVRYKQAAMGFLWAIFMPIIAVCAGILIKKAMAVVAQQPIDTKGILSISVKVLPWTFFVSSIRFAVQSLVGNGTLVTKIYFPRAVLPLSSTLACLFDLAVAGCVLTVLLVIFNVGVSIYLLWLPLLILFLFSFTFGLGLLLSAANLFFRDVKYVVEIILMFGIFFTPVFYDASSFGQWKFIMLLNPIGSILEGIDDIIVNHLAPEPIWLGYAFVSSMVMLLFGLYIFYKNESAFAENI